MEWLVPLGIVVVGVFAAYKVHDHLQFKTNNAVPISFGVAGLSLLIAQGVGRGFASIAGTVAMIVILGAMAMAGLFLNKVWGTKAAIGGVIATFVAGALIASSLGVEFGSDCYTDWDGRSNSTVCD